MHQYASTTISSITTIICITVCIITIMTICNNMQHISNMHNDNNMHSSMQHYNKKCNHSYASLTLICKTQMLCINNHHYNNHTLLICIITCICKTTIKRIRICIITIRIICIRMQHNNICLNNNNVQKNMHHNNNKNMYQYDS